MGHVQEDQAPWEVKLGGWCNQYYSFQQFNLLAKRLWANQGWDLLQTINPSSPGRPNTRDTGIHIQIPLSRQNVIWRDRYTKPSTRPTSKQAFNMSKVIRMIAQNTTSWLSKPNSTSKLMNWPKHSMANQISNQLYQYCQPVPQCWKSDPPSLLMILEPNFKELPWSPIISITWNRNLIRIPTSWHQFHGEYC